MRSVRLLVTTGLCAFAAGCGGSFDVPTEEGTPADDAIASETSATTEASVVVDDSSAPDTLAIDSSAPDTSSSIGDSGTDTSAPDTSAPDTSAPDSDASGTDVGPTCSASQKLCESSCVSKSAADWGCGGSSCAPCPSDPHGDPVCASDGSCSVACDFGYHLCGSSCAAVGPSSCGASCTVCSAPANSTATCTSGACGSVCKTGYADCNGIAGDGCEKNLDTDAANCGACGHSCAGDACVAGMCVPKTIAVGQNDPSDLAVDDVDLYWTNNGANQVVKAPKVGGTSTIVASSQPSPYGIALDDGYVYWTQNTTPGAVVRAPKSGGTPQVVASSQYYAFRLVLAGPTIYFIGDSTGGFLRSVPKSGGTVVDLQTASSPKGLAYDGTKIYWTAWNEVRKADPAPLAPPTKLSTSEQFPAALAADDANLYWLDMYADKIRKVAKTGGTPTTLATLTYGTPRGAIAIDATYVYYVDPKGDAVRKVPKAGGAAITIATASDPRGLTLDDKFVYWSNGGDGTVMRVAK